MTENDQSSRASLHQLSDITTARLLGRVIASDFALHHIITYLSKDKSKSNVEKILHDLIKNHQAAVAAYMAEQKSSNMLVSHDTRTIEERYIEALNYYLEKLSPEDDSSDNSERPFPGFQDS